MNALDSCNTGTPSITLAHCIDLCFLSRVEALLKALISTVDISDYEAPSVEQMPGSFDNTAFTECVCADDRRRGLHRT